MPLSSGVYFLSPTIPVHVFDAEKPGPVSIIQAGIHGDEIAGVHALEELLEEGLRPKAGRLIITPIMNPGAYRARNRTAPGGLDMNRSFPGDSGAEERELRIAAAFMKLIADEKPTLMATLHESWKRFHPEIPVSFGQTIVYAVQPMPEIVPSVIAKMNEAIQNPYELWAPHYYPVDTSSTEVIVDKVGCIGLCVETWMGFELGRRVAMQKEIVTRLLEAIGTL